MFVDTNGFRPFKTSALAFRASGPEHVGSGLLLRFATGTLSIHPKLAELAGPEMAILDGFPDICDVGRPGEDTFADLR